MKKIFKMFVLLLLFNITKVEAITFTSSYIGNYHYVEDSGRWGDFEMFYRTDNQKVAYCIQPGVNKTTENYKEYTGLDESELASKVGLTKEKLEKISLYAYYGYAYIGHTTKEWFVATQALIWDELGHKYSFTSQNNPSNPGAFKINTPEPIKSKMETIKSLVHNHKAMPSNLVGKNFELGLNKLFQIKDELLNNFEIERESSEVSLNGNTLTITPHDTSKKNVTLTLKKKYDYFPNGVIVYHHDKGQDLLQPGNVRSEFSFSYESFAGTLNLKKFDKITNSCEVNGTRSLEKAIYGVYDEENNLFAKLTIHNCEATLDNIPLGRYYLQELEAPYGYQLDEKKYYFEITKEHVSNPLELKVYDVPKMTLIKINKKYLSYNNITLNEEGAVFQIYSNTSKKLVTEMKTDKDGNASISLPYDSYTLVQKSGKENYNFIPNETFEINELSQEETNFYFVNYPNYGKIHLEKKDNETKACISNNQDNEVIYGLYLLDGTLIKEISFQCEINVDNLILGDYYLQEIKAPYGYEVDKEKHYFTLDKENIDIPYSMTFYDIKKKVELKINKKYHYDDNIYLDEEKAVFNIYNRETNEPIKTLETDSNGNASIVLPYGKYIIKQVKGKKNYEYIKDKEFEINDDTKNLTLSFINEPIKKKIHLIKIEKETKKRIYLANIQFKIYDLERQKYVCENETCLYETNMFGEFMTDSLYPSTYVIEEVKKKNTNLLYNAEKMQITLDEDSEDIVLVYFENEVVKGEIVVRKTNENNEPLQGVTFGLYAKEDIYDVNKKLIFHKNDLVSQKVTDENGKIIFSNLSLGEYYIEEIRALDGYVIDKTKYDFALEYQDEDTNTIKEEIILLNVSVPNTKKESSFPLFLVTLICLKGWFMIHEKNNKFNTFSRNR